MMSMTVLRTRRINNNRKLEPFLRKKTSGWIENTHWEGPIHLGFWYQTRRSCYDIYWACPWTLDMIHKMGYTVLFFTGKRK